MATINFYITGCVTVRVLFNHMSQPSVYRILGSILDLGPSCLSVYVAFRRVGKIAKSDYSFVLSVCPFVRLSAWNNSAPTGRVFMIF